jgi:hypothetical protein
MADVTSSGPVTVPPGGTKPSNAAILSQIFAVVFAVPAVAWGVFVVWSTAFPPKCGDWSGLTSLGVVECWVVDLPIGLLILAIGLFVKKGSPRLRRICIGASAVTLSLPIIASLLLSRWHCP